MYLQFWEEQLNTWEAQNWKIEMEDIFLYIILVITPLKC